MDGKGLNRRQGRRFMLMPQDHTVMVRQTSKWGQILLLSLVGLGATAFATAWLYRIDEVITVQGRLVPQSGGVEVKSPISGKLDQVLVKRGDEVKKGEVMLRFDVVGAKAEERSLKERMRLEEIRVKDQLKTNDKRKETLKRNISLTTKILNRLEPLVESGAISELQILAELNKLETQKDELIQLQNSRNSINNDSNTRIAEINGQLDQVKNRLRNQEIKSPIKGIVFDLKPDNNKYVVTNAEPLLKIVPKGSLGAEVNVTNKDIGFLREGQRVKVRVNSFPYTEYGELRGWIKSIGADALPPNQLIRNYHFPVDIQLNKSELETRDGTKIQLQAGMTITTNLKLRDRRLIELLGDLFADRGESLKRLRQP